MSRRRTNNIAALIAGFGTGYLNAEEAARKRAQDEEDRDLRRREIQSRIDEKEAQLEREKAVADGLEAANKMKVGELRNDEGAVDNSETAWRERLATPDNQGNIASQEVIDRTAPIYAQQAKQKGAENWMSGEMMGDVKPTTKGDIYRSKADAIAKLGISGIPQSMAMQEKADQLDLADLKKRIAAGTPETLAKEYDDIFPDGLTLKFDEGQDGKLYKYTEDAQGNKSNWQTFKDLDDFKQQMMAMVDDNPDAITQYWNESRKREREDKMSDLQFQKLDQDIAKGKIELESLPEKTRLEFAAKKAAINASNASASASYATAEEKRSNKGGAKDDKLPNSVREALWYKDASPEQKAAFDLLGTKDTTKVTSDGMGGFIVNDKNGIHKVDVKGNVSKVNIGGEVQQANTPIVPDETRKKTRAPISNFD